MWKIILLFILIPLKVFASGPQQPYISNPTTYGNLIFWFDGSDTSSLTIVTGVSQWNDKSGNGFNAVQATGARQPTSGVNTINGLNVIKFGGNASNQFMTFSGSMKPNTIGSVFKNHNATYTDWEGVIVSRSSGSTKTADSTFASGFTGDQTQNTNITNVGQTSVGAYIDGTIGSATNFDNFAVGISASPITQAHIFINTINNGSNGTQNYAIGADVFGAVGARHADADIGELFGYSIVTDVPQVMGLTWYAKRKWAIP